MDKEVHDRLSDAPDGAQEAIAATNSEGGLDAQELAALSDEIVAALKSVYDPEIPVDIYELGLVYRIDISDTKDIEIDMTLTAPGCPVAAEMPDWARDAVMGIDGVGDVKINLVFDPPWSTDLMSEEAKLELNMF